MGYSPYGRKELGRTEATWHQGISLIQGSSLHLLHWQADSITTEQPGNPLLMSQADQELLLTPFVL